MAGNFRGFRHMCSELIFVVLIFVTIHLPTRGAAPTIIVCPRAWRLACVYTYLTYVRTCTCTPLDLGRDRDREELRTFTVY